MIIHGVREGFVRGYFGIGYGGWPEWFAECCETEIDLAEIAESSHWPVLARAFSEIHKRPESLLARDIVRIQSLEDRMMPEDSDCYERPGPDDWSGAIFSKTNMVGRDITIAEFDEMFAEIMMPFRTRAMTKTVKQSAMKQRRVEFSQARPGLILAMLDRGDNYVCARTGCNKTGSLAIDHIKPLSRGGTDDLDNLQFMCTSCNSTKGATVVSIDRKESVQ